MPQKRLKDTDAVGDYDYYLGTVAKKHGLTYTQYLTKLAKRHGFKNYHEYVKHLRERHGFHTQEEYLQWLADRKGVKSVSAYLRLLMRKRASRPRYQKLATALNDGFAESGMTLTELSQKTKIDRQTLWTYFKGYFYPRKERLKILAEALGLLHLIPPEKELEPLKNKPVWPAERPPTIPLRNWRIANHIRSEMKRLGLRNIDVEKRVGIQIRHIIYGRSYPENFTLKKLSRIMNVSPFLPQKTKE